MRENEKDTNFTVRRLRQAYGLTLELIRLLEKVIKRTKEKANEYTLAITQNLELIKMQIKNVYQESLWMLKENYISALKVMNRYVIYSKAFSDTYASLQEDFQQKFLGRVQELCSITGFKFNIQEAKDFFSEANTLCEGQEDEVKDLFVILKKAVALHIGKEYGALGQNFYSAYTQVIKEKTNPTLKDYIESCKEVFREQWNNDYDKASEYYVYTRWDISKLTIGSLKKYAIEHSHIGKVKSLIDYMLNMIAESYLNLYESLIETYYDESVMSNSQSDIKDSTKLDGKMERLLIYNKKAKDVFQFYGDEIREYIRESYLYKWSGTTLEFAKSNGLKVKSLCITVAKKFKEGMIIIYNKGANTITVVVDTLKNPENIIKVLKGKFKNLRARIAGYVLILDFDADGWVSMVDFIGSIKLMHQTLKLANCLGNAKGLYLKAIGSMKKERAEEGEIEAQKAP